MTFDDLGNLFVVSYNDQRLYQITPQRELSVFAQSSSGSAFVSYSNGYFYLSKTTEHTIERVDLMGVVERFVGDGEAGFVEGPRLAEDQGTDRLQNRPRMLLTSRG